MYAVLRFEDFGASYFSVQNRAKPSSNRNIRRGSAHSTRAYTRRSNLYPSMSNGRSKYRCATTGALVLPTFSPPPPRESSALHACRSSCTREIPFPWHPASGLRMNVLCLDFLASSTVLNSSKNSSSCAGRLYVFGEKSNSCGYTTSSRARFLARLLLRHISSMPTKWLIF